MFTLYFSCGHYAVSSASVFAATRLAYDMHLDAYSIRCDLIFVLSEVYDVLKFVCISFWFIWFSS